MAGMAVWPRGRMCCAFQGVDRANPTPPAVPAHYGDGVTLSNDQDVPHGSATPDGPQNGAPHPSTASGTGTDPDGSTDSFPDASPDGSTNASPETWSPTAVGVLRLPSGRLVRGRGLRRPLPEGPRPSFALYLLGKEPPAVGWEARWLRWPDFRLPTDRQDAADALREVLTRAGTERVEVACGGGRGRTGTALACLAVLDGVPASEAVAYVRRHYAKGAVETPWQRRYVERFG